MVGPCRINRRTSNVIYVTPSPSFGQSVLAGRQSAHAVSGRCVFFVPRGAVAACLAIMVSACIEAVRLTIIFLLIGGLLAWTALALTAAALLGSF